jgi:hypothetical protein
MARRQSSQAVRQDPLFLRNCFSCDNVWKIPTIRRNTNLSLTQIGTIAFDKTKPKDTRGLDKIVHFFIDDCKFQATYDLPRNCLRKISQYKHILTPDFSLYEDMPLALQLYNTFRNRWCGAFWQDLGLSVFPTISWSNENSYDFCFTGVPVHSIVAVSTNGCKATKPAFLKGYNEMLKRLNPQLVLCFDKPFKEMKGEIIYFKCDTFPKEDKKWEEEDRRQLLLDLGKETFGLKKNIELNREELMQKFCME